MAFESKLAKSSKSTDFRISPTLCTMFNVMVDAKDQSAKLCAMEMGSEVKETDLRAAGSSRSSTDKTHKTLNQNAVIFMKVYQRLILLCVSFASLRRNSSAPT